jgi:hypothetical protein
MGAANRRGTYEERKEAAIKQAADEKPLSEEDREAIRQHLEKLTVKERESAMKLISVYTTRTQFFDRILHAGATPAELKGE